jgi:hypothetical protein
MDHDGRAYARLNVRRATPCRASVTTGSVKYTVESRLKTFSRAEWSVLGFASQ